MVPVTSGTFVFLLHLPGHILPAHTEHRLDYARSVRCCGNFMNYFDPLCLRWVPVRAAAPPTSWTMTCTLRPSWCARTAAAWCQRGSWPTTRSEVQVGRRPVVHLSGRDLKNIDMYLLSCTRNEKKKV